MQRWRGAGQRDDLRRVFGSTLRGVLFLAIPAAVGLFVWRVPLVQALLERGEFTERSTLLTVSALAFYAFGLVGHSAIEIFARAYYALHDTRTPVIVGIAAMALNIVLSLWLRIPLALAGLALANTIAATLEMLLMAILISRRLGGLEWPQLFATVLKSGAAALLHGVTIVVGSRQFEWCAGIVAGASWVACRRVCCIWGPPRFCVCRNFRPFGGYCQGRDSLPNTLLGKDDAGTLRLKPAAK